MTDPSTPTTPRRVWRPTFTQVRLGVLVMALVSGGYGMAQRDQRLIYTGIGFGVAGVVMRMVRSLRERGAVRQGRLGTGDE